MFNALTVVAELVAKPGRESELREQLLGLIEPTRKEDGCLQYDLHEHTSDQGRFVFYENWTSEEALARHAASPHLQALGKVAPDLLAEPARILTYRRLA
ncbi:MAG TPA: antibiotic biosynthesis monooxygenase [Solibacterales bacterium]|nr:antibiotic biosynthesis monooxygenase [Bryobacterales bacterium]